MEAEGLFLLQQHPHSALVWAEGLTHLPECCTGFRLVQGSGTGQEIGLQAASLSPGTTLPVHLKQDCPCQYLSPAPDMKHSSSSAVYPGGE